jgi:hypothetical protein
MKRPRLKSEHGPIRCIVRVGIVNPAALDALRILARLVVAKARQNRSSALPSSPGLCLTVPRGVAG